MLKHLRNYLYIGLIVPCVTAIALHAYNGAHTRFIADDYCFAYFVQRLGFFRDIWFWYSTSQGRYSQFATDSVLLWTGTKGVGAIVTIALLVWASAIIGTLFGLQLQAGTMKLKLQDSIVFGIVLLFVILALSPNIPQSLYWWSGLHTHTAPLIVFTIYIALYQWIKILKPNTGMLAFVAIGSFLISFIDDGFSEIFTAAQLAMLALWIAWLFLKKELDFRQPGTAYLAGGLAGGLVALIVAFISPGNVVRQSYFPARPGIFAILQISFVNYFAFLLDIFTTPEKALGIAGVFISFLWLGKQNVPKRSSPRWELFIIFVISFFLLPYACFTPAAFGMSDAPPTRALIIPVFFTVFGTALTGYLCGNQLAKPSASSPETPRENLSLLLIAMILIIISAGINGKYLYGSSVVYIKYAQAWDQNEQKIFGALESKQDTVVIHSVRNWAGLNDPGDNPKFYVNYCMSKYYNINILADNTGMQPPEP